MNQINISTAIAIILLLEDHNVNWQLQIIGVSAWIPYMPVHVFKQNVHHNDNYYNKFQAYNMQYINDAKYALIIFMLFALAQLHA